MCLKVICHIFLPFKKTFSVYLWHLFGISWSVHYSTLFSFADRLVQHDTVWKKRKKDGSSTSENLPPTPCHVTQCARRFAACKVFFFFSFCQLFFSFYARSSSWTPSPALSCLPSIFTHFPRQIHHSESFQLVCHGSPLKVSQQSQRHPLSLSYSCCTRTYITCQALFVWNLKLCWSSWEHEPLPHWKIKDDQEELIRHQQADSWLFWLTDTNHLWPQG